VVQIGTLTMACQPPRRILPPAPASIASYIHRRPGSLVGISISASASAEPQSKHQCTGLTPRARWPHRRSRQRTQHVRLELNPWFTDAPSRPDTEALEVAICRRFARPHCGISGEGRRVEHRRPPNFFDGQSIGSPWQSHPAYAGAEADSSATSPPCPEYLLTAGRCGSRRSHRRSVAQHDDGFPAVHNLLVQADLPAGGFPALGNAPSGIFRHEMVCL
jgi:hypothetical protein